jgi:hypothetical protein
MTSETRAHRSTFDRASQANRRYAAALLQRLEGRLFDHRDVQLISFVIPLIEADIRALLERHAAEVERHHAVAPGYLRFAADLIEQGEHRQCERAGPEADTP